MRHLTALTAALLLVLSATGVVQAQLAEAASPTAASPTAARPTAASPTAASPTDDGGPDTDRREAILDHAAGYEMTGDATLDGAARFQSDACIPDPTGDTHPGDFGKADIVAFCVRHTADSVLFELTPRTASNPVTDPNWVNGVTGWITSVDIDDDHVEDGFLLFWNDGSGVYVDVFDSASGDYVCTGQTGLSGATFLARVPTSCLGSPQILNAVAILFYDSDWDDPHAPVYDDVTDGVARTTPNSPAPAPAPAPAPEPTAPPAATRDTLRLAGPDRIGTAVAISRHQFPAGAQEVYLSRSDEFADSIASGSLTRGPILLVPQCGPVPEVVLEEVRRLRATTVVALGGTSAVCDDVLAQVAGA